MSLSDQPNDQGRTYALLVGIEDYDFEPPIPLPGCELACQKFQQWLLQNRVPANNIFVHVSSRGQGRTTELKSINDSIAAIISARAELVFVYWAGHGYAVDKQRYVYTADSRALGFSQNVDDLIERIGSSNGDLTRIIGIFDCCANAVSPEYQLQSQALAHIHRRHFDIWIWFACGIGEFADYNPSTGGEFSAELFSEIEKTTLPLNIDEIDIALRGKFEHLKQKGQRPFRYYALTPNGDFRVEHSPPQEPHAPVSIKIATVSHRGGVGKTTLAVNLAVELASIATVVLVDCDESGRGATEWLKRDILHFDDKTLTLQSFAEFALDDRGNLTCKPNEVFGRLKLAVVPQDKIPEDYFQHPMPGRLYFVPFATSWRGITEAGSRYWGRAVRNFVQTIGLYRPDFVIFDCSPGANAVTTAVCSTSDIGILISPYHRDDMRQGALTLLRLQHNGANTIQWRLVANTLPTNDIYKNTPDIFEEAQIIAQEIARDQDIKFSEMRSILSVMIPDLEEFRDYHRDDRALSKFKRGGNCFVLCVRLLLNSLQCDGLLGESARSLPFMRNSSDLTYLKEDVYSKFLDRIGYGKAGLDRRSLIWPILYGLLFVIYSVIFLLSIPTLHGSPPYITGNVTTFLRIYEALLIAASVAALASFLHYIWRALRGHDVFKQFYPEQIDELRLERIYNQGGNRATTSNFWWPRVAWLLTFVLVMVVVLTKWILYDEFGYIMLKNLPVTVSIGAILAILGLPAFTNVFLRKTVRELLFRAWIYVYRSVQPKYYR